MKIDFTKIMCRRKRKGEPEPVNIAEQIGELIYHAAATRKQDQLSNTIGDSTGEIQLSDDEAEFVAEVIAGRSNLFWALKEALCEALGHPELMQEKER